MHVYDNNIVTIAVDVLVQEQFSAYKVIMHQYILQPSFVGPFDVVDPRHLPTMLMPYPVRPCKCQLVATSWWRDVIADEAGQATSLAYIMVGILLCFAVVVAVIVAVVCCYRRRMKATPGIGST